MTWFDDLLAEFIPDDKDKRKRSRLMQRGVDVIDAHSAGPRAVADATRQPMLAPYSRVPLRPRMAEGPASVPITPEAEQLAEITKNLRVGRAIRSRPEETIRSVSEGEQVRDALHDASRTGLQIGEFVNPLPSLGLAAGELVKGNSGTAGLYALGALPLVGPALRRGKSAAASTARHSSRQLRELAGEIATNRRAGFTYDPRAKQFISDGIVVANPPGQRAVISRGMSPKVLKRAIHANKNLLEDPRYFLGGWHDGSTNEFWTEVAERVPDRDAALAAMRDRNEKAAFDLSTFDEVPNPHYDPSMPNAGRPPIRLDLPHSPDTGVSGAEILAGMGAGGGAGLAAGTQAGQAAEDGDTGAALAGAGLGAGLVAGSVLPALLSRGRGLRTPRALGRLNERGVVGRDILADVGAGVGLPDLPVRADRAARNTGALYDADGKLFVDMMRWQHPAQGGKLAPSRGVFFHAKDADSGGFRGTNMAGFGGSQKATAEGRFQNPLVLPHPLGRTLTESVLEAYPEAASHLDAEGLQTLARRADNLQDRVGFTEPGSVKPEMQDELAYQLQKDILPEVLSKGSDDPGIEALAQAMVRPHMSRSPWTRIPFAIRDLYGSEIARERGHDAIATFWPRGNGTLYRRHKAALPGGKDDILQEVFDLTRTHYPHARPPRSPFRQGSIFGNERGAVGAWEPESRGVFDRSLPSLLGSAEEHPLLRGAVGPRTGTSPLAQGIAESPAVHEGLLALTERGLPLGGSSWYDLSGIKDSLERIGGRFGWREWLNASGAGSMQTPTHDEVVNASMLLRGLRTGVTDRKALEDARLAAQPGARKTLFGQDKVNTFLRGQEEGLLLPSKPSAPFRKVGWYSHGHRGGSPTGDVALDSKARQTLLSLAANDPALATLVREETERQRGLKERAFIANAAKKGKPTPTPAQIERVRNRVRPLAPITNAADYSALSFPFVSLAQMMDLPSNTVQAGAWLGDAAGNNLNSALRGDYKQTLEDALLYTAQMTGSGTSPTDLQNLWTRVSQGEAFLWPTPKTQTSYQKALSR